MGPGLYSDLVRGCEASFHPTGGIEYGNKLESKLRIEDNQDNYDLIDGERGTQKATQDATNAVSLASLKLTSSNFSMMANKR